MPFFAYFQAVTIDVEDLEEDASPEDMMLSYVSAEKGKVRCMAIITVLASTNHIYIADCWYRYVTVIHVFIHHIHLCHLTPHWEGTKLTMCDLMFYRPWLFFLHVKMLA